MHHPLPMRVIQRGGDLPRNGQRAFDTEPVLADERLSQRFAAHVRQDIVEQPVRCPRIDQREDVGMIEPGRDTNFLKKAITSQYGAEFGAQHLERYRPIVLEIGGQVDRCHAPGPEFAFKPVTVGESRRDAGLEFGVRHALV